MAEYHVGCGFAGIYAGTLKKNGKEWLSKSCVTDEAIRAVADWLYMERGDKKKHGYSWNMSNGSKIKLILEVVNGEDDKTE